MASWQTDLARALILGSALGAPVAGLASTHQMICENSRREYVVKLDDSFNHFHADDTAYKVLAVERTDEKFIVVGLTVNGGPTFRAHFRPYKKMEFFADNQLFQTDGCR
jgi:hypothetical protein